MELPQQWNVVALDVVPNDDVGTVEKLQRARYVVGAVGELLKSVDVDDPDTVNFGGIGDEPVRLGVEQ